MSRGNLMGLIRRCYEYRTRGIGRPFFKSTHKIHLDKKYEADALLRQFHMKINRWQPIKSVV
jgi:hypothetical protein